MTTRSHNQRNSRSIGLVVDERASAEQPLICVMTYSASTSVADDGNAVSSSPWRSRRNNGSAVLAAITGLIFRVVKTHTLRIIKLTNTSSVAYLHLFLWSPLAARNEEGSQRKKKRKGNHSHVDPHPVELPLNGSYQDRPCPLSDSASKFRPPPPPLTQWTAERAFGLSC